MITSPIFLLVALTGCLVLGDNIREPRWFSRGERTITKTVKTTKIVTQHIPSSCVVVQTSLPPCRNIRAVNNIQPTQPTRLMQTQAPGPIPMNQEQQWKPITYANGPVQGSMQDMKTATTVPTPITTKPSSWGWNFFNFGPKEVYTTQTIVELQTTKYMDPNTVVTFSVKGCRPSRLPFDLPECETIRAESPPPVVKSPESGIVVMAPIQFVPASSMPMKTPEAPKEDVKIATAKPDEKEKNKDEKKPEEKKE